MTAPLDPFQLRSGYRRSKSPKDRLDLRWVDFFYSTIYSGRPRSGLDRLLAFLHCLGNLIIGEESLDRFLARRGEAYTRADYPRLASGVLTGQPGSSAGGEHPKFAIAAGERHLLVKFATGDGEAADRWRALLVAEHVA
jgi:hypothetical protein